MYLRYVDDTFVMFGNRKESSGFLNDLNNLHKNLSFTKEEEHNNSLNFLGVCVQRSVEGELLTKIHRKFRSIICSVGIFWSSQAEVRSFNGYGEAFHQTLFSLLS